MRIEEPSLESAGAGQRFLTVRLSFLQPNLILRGTWRCVYSPPAD